MIEKAKQTELVFYTKRNAEIKVTSNSSGTLFALNSKDSTIPLSIKQKIIPQLQEYFFDDWAKINLVLNGNGMLQSKPIEKSAIFPNVDSEELGYFVDKKAWELVPT